MGNFWADGGRNAMRTSRAGVVFLIASLLFGLLPSSVARPSYAAESPASAVPAGAPQRIDLRVGMLPVTAFLGFYYARDEGWLTEEGLNVDVQVMAGAAEIIPAMIGGSLDVGIANVFSHILARDRGF